MTLLAFWLGCAVAAAALAVGLYRAVRDEELIPMRLRRGRWLFFALQGDRYELVPLRSVPAALLRGALGGLKPREAAAASAEEAQVRRVGVGRRIPVPSPHRA